jgi:hypothetical protein
MAYARGSAILFGTVMAVAILFAMAAANINIQQWDITKRWTEAAVPAVANVVKRLSAPEIVHDHDPFLQLVGKTTGVRYHPLIDIAGTQFMYNVGDFFEKRDYFGFRNRFDAYSERGDYRYIVLTGNSEAVGMAQDVTIAERLQRILNEHGSNFRVLNLAMNSATTANEINYFVHLAFDLKPEFVISHSFVTDIYYGMRLPKQFRQLGLLYPELESAWSRKINESSMPSKAFEIPGAEPGSYDTLDGLTANVRRYKAIAGASGAQFVWGIQKFDWHNTIGSPDEANWHRVDDHYQELRRRIAGLSDLDIIDFNTLVPPIALMKKTDPIHTADDSAERIAQTYAAWIIPRLRERGGVTVNHSPAP